MSISYPVASNLTFTVYSDTLSGPILDGQGKERRRIPWLKMSLDDTQMISGLAADTHILQDVTDPRPTVDVDYDPLTHKVGKVATVYDTVNETATDGWELVALTQAEIDAAADNADRAAKLTGVGTQVATLRAWAATAAGTTVTNGNAVAVLQVVVDHQATFFAKFADLIEGQRIDQ